jgi:serine/threonine protein kinase
VAFQIGEQVGDYQVLEVLGGGGMGAVYKVRNVISGRVEAMKVLLENLQDNPEILDRFLREIRVLAALEHPNIAALRTAQRAGNQILMIMELVEGETLQALMKKGRVQVADAVRYARDALGALAAAHERGIVHRDIKPANMMLNRQGVLKLMDFGIARLATDRQLTKTGLTLGSIFYMSPEQINGSEIDARSDIYSMGITLYELVTGRRPFEGDSDFSIMAAHIQQPPKAPLELDPSLPEELNHIILMALEKDPAKRFQSATAMRNALDRVLENIEGRAASPAAAAPGPAAVRVPSAPPAQPSMKPGSGMRLVYILAGSLATLAVLIVAAIQVPKWRTTEAVEAPSSIEAPAPAQDLTPTPAPTQDPTPSAALPQPVPSPQGPPAARPGPAPTLASPAPGPASPAPTPPSPTQPTAPPPSASQEPPGAPAAVPSEAKPQPAAETRVGAEIREQFMLLATRVGAVRQSLDRLKQQQAQMGLGLRQDMAAAEQRLIFRMDEAEDALRAGDARRAVEQMNAAERELGQLERLMGR